MCVQLLRWFEILHDLLTSDLQRSSTPLLTVTEAFFDYFLVRSKLGDEQLIDQSGPG